MSKYHYRVTKFSKPFNEDDDQLKEMFWQAVAENLKATDNLNIWLESSKTDISTWKLLEGDADYKLVIWPWSPNREELGENFSKEKLKKLEAILGVESFYVDYFLECRKFSKPFIIAAVQQMQSHSIYFMERVDKDQLTDMEYALSNLPEKQIGTIKVGDDTWVVPKVKEEVSYSTADERAWY